MWLAANSLFKSDSDPQAQSGTPVLPACRLPVGETVRTIF